MIGVQIRRTDERGPATVAAREPGACLRIASLGIQQRSDASLTAPVLAPGARAHPDGDRLPCVGVQRAQDMGVLIAQGQAEDDQGATSAAQLLKPKGRVVGFP
jgi:hypothetical protein